MKIRLHNFTFQKSIEVEKNAIRVSEVAYSHSSKADKSQKIPWSDMDTDENTHSKKIQFIKKSSTEAGDPSKAAQADR